MIVRVFVYVGQGVVCIQEVLYRYLKPYEKTSKACEWSQIYCVYKHLPLSVSTSGAGGPALLNQHGTNLSLRNNCFSRFSLFVQVKETRTSWPLPPTQTPKHGTHHLAQASSYTQRTRLRETWEVFLRRTPVLHWWVGHTWCHALLWCAVNSVLEGSGAGL